MAMRRIILLFAGMGVVALSGCESLQAKRERFPRADKIAVPPTARGRVEEPTVKYRIDSVNKQVTRYNELIGTLNQKMAKADSEIDKIQKGNLGMKGLGIAGGIAVAAMTAAAPEANAAWIQGVNAFNTGIVTMQGEMLAQGIAAEVLIQYQQAMAKAVSAAKTKINFPELEAKALTADETEWAEAMKILGEGMNALEDAVLLTSKKLKVEVKVTS